MDNCLWPRHFHEELQALKAKLLQMGVLVEEAIEKSVEALLERNPRLARDVMEEENIINQFEIDIDNKGRALLALDQPMAADLRFITAILKINNDLERMGDHAVNIAERALILIKEPPLKRNLQLSEMAGAALKMLAESIDAFMNSNTELARSVLKQDDEIDAYNDNLFSKAEELMQKDYSFVTIGMNLVMIGHNLERIADLATLYGVGTRELNKAVTRNLDYFPGDFMFQLTSEEFKNLMFHFGTSRWGGVRKRPRAFMEQGVAMLSSVLKSKQAVQVNIEIMRAFVRLRQMLSPHAQLARKLEALEKRYDTQFKAVFDAIRELMTPPALPKRPIGFHRE